MSWKDKINWYRPEGGAHYEKVWYNGVRYDIHWHAGAADPNGGRWAVWKGLTEITGNLRKKIAQRYVDINTEKEKMLCVVTAKQQNDILACCTTSSPCVAVPTPTMAQNKKENAMYDNDFDRNDNRTPDERTKEFLINRLHGAASEKTSQAYMKFLADENPPQSPKELVDRIKEGRFQFASARVNPDGTWKDEDYAYHGNPICSLLWRATPADHEAYTRVMSAISKAKNTAFEDIQVGIPEDGLKVLREFQARDFLNS